MAAHWPTLHHEDSIPSPSVITPDTFTAYCWHPRPSQDGTTPDGRAMGWQGLGCAALMSASLGMSDIAMEYTWTKLMKNELSAARLSTPRLWILRCERT